MDLRQLRYFVAIAECRSISLAAKKVHIAQPALTRQMQVLEEDFGTSLFQRTARGITLTNAGQQLLIDANRILDDAEGARARVQSAGRGEVGHLSIAIPVMRHPARAVARIFDRYRRETPNVSLEINQVLSEKQLRLLRENRIDVGISLFRDVADTDLKGERIYSERIFLAYPANWVWLNGVPQSLSDLNEVEFIWISRNSAPAWHDELIHCFFKAGFVPKPRITSADASSMLTLVAAGLGCTVVPESQATGKQDSVNFLELNDLDVVQHWEIVWRADNTSPLIERFVEIAVNNGDCPRA